MADFRIYARSLPDDQALNLFLLHLGLLVRCFTHLGEEHGRCYQHRGSPGSDCAMLTTAFESRGGRAILPKARRLASMDAATVLAQRLDVPDTAAECRTLKACIQILRQEIVAHASFLSDYQCIFWRQACGLWAV